MRALAEDEELATVSTTTEEEWLGEGVAQKLAVSAAATTTTSNDRLWSNLDMTQTPFRHEPGSLPGAIALVAGTTVGAGMLALPAVCQGSGFVPSTFALTGCWIYMLATGLLVLEVRLYPPPSRRLKANLHLMTFA